MLTHHDEKRVNFDKDQRIQIVEKSEEAATISIGKRHRCEQDGTLNKCR